MSKPEDEEVPDNVIDIATWKWKKERKQLEKELEEAGWLTEDDWVKLRDESFEEFDEHDQQEDD